MCLLCDEVPLLAGERPSIETNPRTVASWQPALRRCITSGTLITARPLQRELAGISVDAQIASVDDIPAGFGHESAQPRLQSFGEAALLKGRHHPRR